MATDLRKPGPGYCRDLGENPIRSGTWKEVGKAGAGNKPGSVLDNHSSGTIVTDRLEQPTREPARDRRRASRPMLPYLVLLRAGFTVPRTVTSRAVRSYRTFSPLPDRRRPGGIFSVALSMGSHPPGVTWRPVRRSPDFPPGCDHPGDCLADSDFPNRRLYRSGGPPTRLLPPAHATSSMTIPELPASEEAKSLPIRSAGVRLPLGASCAIRCSMIATGASCVTV